ncbi:MAG: hypothetical protein SF028_02690 [Candidatus Sumerlaeia bacterium]|nr:hypothetical protein [Candidatus Sumerlaeia bacterium]
MGESPTIIERPPLFYPAWLGRMDPYLLRAETNPAVPLVLRVLKFTPWPKARVAGFFACLAMLSINVYLFRFVDDLPWLLATFLILLVVMMACAVPPRSLVARIRKRPDANTIFTDLKLAGVGFDDVLEADYLVRSCARLPQAVLLGLLMLVLPAVIIGVSTRFSLFGDTLLVLGALAFAAGVAATLLRGTTLKAQYIRQTLAKMELNMERRAIGVGGLLKKHSAHLMTRTAMQVLGAFGTLIALYVGILVIGLAVHFIPRIGLSGAHFRGLGGLALGFLGVIGLGIRRPRARATIEAHLDHWHAALAGMHEKYMALNVYGEPDWTDPELAPPAHSGGVLLPIPKPRFTRVAERVQRIAPPPPPRPTHG